MACRNINNNFQPLSNIFEHTGIAGLIFYGRTDDTQEIKKIFQAREEVFSYCIQDLDANLNNSLSNNVNNIVLGHS